MARFVEENTELPSTLRDLIAFYRAPEGRERLEHWERLAAEAASLQFVGMGTSEFTSEALAWRLTARGRLSRSCDAGELFYEEDFHAPSGGLFVLTSQSGESVEIRNLAGLERVGRHVAVTNDEASSLAKWNVSSSERVVKTSARVGASALLTAIPITPPPAPSRPAGDSG